MKFKIILDTEAQKEFDKLEKTYQSHLKRDYDKIENIGIEFVNTEYLRKDLYEIKTDNIRSLYSYKKGQKIIVAIIFLKKTQKTPEKYINLAYRRLQKYE